MAQLFRVYPSTVRVLERAVAADRQALEMAEVMHWHIGDMQANLAESEAALAQARECVSYPLPTRPTGNVGSLDPSKLLD